LKWHYLGNDTRKEFNYDFLDRIIHIQYQKQDETQWVNRAEQRYEYDSFHLISETNENDEKTRFKYNSLGALLSVVKGKEKTEYEYDALGRICALKQWNDVSSFTLHRKKYDWLDHIIEEKVENQNGDVILKKQNDHGSSGR